MHSGLTWKQKLAFSFPLETGGSWRKSPHTISWMPPNGAVDLLTDLQECSEQMCVTEDEYSDFNFDMAALFHFLMALIFIVHFIISYQICDAICHTIQLTSERC